MGATGALLLGFERVSPSHLGLQKEIANDCLPVIADARFQYSVLPKRVWGGFVYDGLYSEGPPLGVYQQS